MFNSRSVSNAFRSCALCLVCSIIATVGAGWAAQQPMAKAQPVTKEDVQSRIQAVTNDATLKDKEPLRKQIIDPYNDALIFLKTEEDHRKRRKELESLEKNLEQLKREAAREIAIEPPDEDAAIGLNLKELSRLKSEAETERDKAFLDKTRWKDEDSLRKERRKSDRSIAYVQKRLKEVRADLNDNKKFSGLPEAVAAARRTSLLAEKQALEQEVALLGAESRVYPESDSLISELKRSAERREERAKKAVQFWTEKVDNHRGTLAQEQLDKAIILKRNLVDSRMPSRLIEMANANIESAEQRTLSKDGMDGTISQLQDAAQLLIVRQNKLTNLKADQKTLEDRLEIEGFENHLGPSLLKQRHNLPDAAWYRRYVRRRGKSLSRIRNEQLDVKKELTRLIKKDDIVQQTLTALPTDIDAATRTRVEVFLREILRQRETILNGLEEDYNLLEKRLLKVSETEVDIADAAEEFRMLIDKHILWIRTARPLWDQDPKEPNALEHAKDTVEWLTSPVHWGEVGTNLIDALASNLLLTALAIVLLATALWKLRPIKRRLGRIGEQVSKGFLEPYWLTLEALALTVLLTSIGPAFCWFIGWNLATWAIPGSFSVSVGHALQSLALIGWSLEFLRRMLRPHGLAEAHFRWRDERLKSLRRHLRWFMATVMVSVFLYVLIDDGGTDDDAESLGRMLLMATLVVFSGFLAVVLRRGRFSINLSATLAADHSAVENQMTRWRVVGYAVTVFAPIVLAGAAAAGYLYTSAFLTWKLICTSWLCLALVVAHALSMRWLYFARGRLALEQAQAAQAAAAQAATEAQSRELAAGQNESEQSESTSRLPTQTTSESVAGTERSDGSSTAGGVSETPSVPQDTAPQQPAADLAAINAQTRRLLRIAIGSAAAVGLWVIWSEIMPALKFLETTIWTTDRSYTLADLLLSLVIVVVVFIAATNLPGLLEVAVLQKLPLDSGARYAVTALARYTIYVVGVIYALTMIGFDWSKVFLLLTALVAALGVGLGFGLQEIFANFVSGIILLFERPLRVGDIVTVGDVSGTVTRIQIRATTIRDWDRKEYVVPNKELVTGKLLNWTLSDSVTRLVFNVGISYSSDPVRAREVLLEIVASHPNVLDKPPVLVTFEEFADSALVLKIRCCVPAIGKRLSTLNDLHAQIHRRFAEEGISIPFPQRDLHIKSDATRENGRPLHLQQSEQSLGTKTDMTPDSPDDKPGVTGKSMSGRWTEESAAE